MNIFRTILRSFDLFNEIVPTGIINNLCDLISEFFSRKFHVKSYLVSITLHSLKALSVSARSILQAFSLRYSQLQNICKSFRIGASDSC